LVSVLKGLSIVLRVVIVHHLLCWAIPSGSLYWLDPIPT
jgi:hypothetical protein